jgi:murein DD-endopeptidase MepM/ murein hydrolase activator NlpD
VHAAREGTAVRVVDQHDRACWEEGCGRYANFVVVLHEDGTTGEYYHLMHRGAAVGEGEFVRRGQLLGWSGHTGKSTMPHLHFAVYRAESWGRTRSLPIRFATREGVVERPRRGARYRHPVEASLAMPAPR